MELGPAPIFGITYDKHSVFVLGGAPHLLDLFTKAQGNDLPDELPRRSPTPLTQRPARSANPYVAKIDPTTMKAQILELPKGTTPNYPGSIVAHRNGKLYAVATATLFEIDPETFEITRSLDLPLNPTEAGLDHLQHAPDLGRNGDLLLKTAPQQGNGLLVAVDVKSMTVRIAARDGRSPPPA